MIWLESIQLYKIDYVHVLFVVVFVRSPEVVNHFINMYIHSDSGMYFIK